MVEAYEGTILNDNNSERSTVTVTVLTINIFLAMGVPEVILSLD